MIEYLLIGIGMIMVSLILLIAAYHMKEESGGIYFFCGGAAAVGIVLFLHGLGEDEPKAIDVYQGNTTLEITYKDSVAVDSVVVFTDEYLKLKK
jgi:hypothetical protein